MSDLTDPRSTLSGSGRTPTVAAVVRKPQLLEFGQIAPAELTAAGTRSWFVRAQNTVVGYSRAVAGTVLRRSRQSDEYVALFPDADARATIRTSEQTVVIAGETIAVVPPGESEVVVERDGQVVRLFSCRSDDLVARCANARAYVVPDPNVKAYEPWPPSPAGPAIRSYALADVVAEAGRFGRIFRCTTVMANVLEGESGPRATHRLSPHHHDDFEQISIQLAGDYVHHLRTPWSARLEDWRPDEALLAASPAVVVIPPPMIHTSRGVGSGEHRLIDVFGPPRLDFSTAGWVLNAEDYPTPEIAQEPA